MTTGRINQVAFLFYDAGTARARPTESARAEAGAAVARNERQTLGGETEVEDRVYPHKALNPRERA